MGFLMLLDSHYMAIDNIANISFKVRSAYGYWSLTYGKYSSSIYKEIIQVSQM